MGPLGKNCKQICPTKWDQLSMIICGPKILINPLLDVSCFKEPLLGLVWRETKRKTTSVWGPNLKLTSHPYATTRAPLLVHFKTQENKLFFKGSPAFTRHRELRMTELRRDGLATSKL